MAATVNVPGIGPTDRRLVVAGAGVTLGIVAWAYLRRANGTATPEPAVLVDPTTGGTAGVDAYDNPDAVRTRDGTIDSTLTEGAPSTAPEWVRAALDLLGMQGIDTGYASSILGRYIAGVQITEQEADVVRQAWALLGKPTFVPRNYTTTGTDTTPTPTPTPSPTPSPAPSPVVVGRPDPSSPLPLTFQVLGLARLERAVRATGHNPGSVVDLSDIAAALTRKKISYGRVVDVSDAANLIRATGS